MTDKPAAEQQPIPGFTVASQGPPNSHPGSCRLCGTVTSVTGLTIGEGSTVLACGPCSTAFKLTKKISQIKAPKVPWKLRGDDDG